MGMGPTATIGFLDESGQWRPVSTDNSLPTTGGGGGGGTDLTSYTQVSSLDDYPEAFPPDLSGVTPGSIGAQPEGDYLTYDDLSDYATTSALTSGLADKADAADLGLPVLYFETEQDYEAALPLPDPSWVIIRDEA